MVFTEVGNQLPAAEDDAPLLRRERSWRSGLNFVNAGADCIGTPVTDVELRKVFEGVGAASLDPDVSMFSATVLLIRTAAAGALRPSDSDRVLLIVVFLPTLVRFWNSRHRDLRRK